MKNLIRAFCLRFSRKTKILYSEGILSGGGASFLHADAMSKALICGITDLLKESCAFQRHASCLLVDLLLFARFEEIHSSSYYLCMLTLKSRTLRRSRGRRQIAFSHCLQNWITQPTQPVSRNFKCSIADYADRDSVQI